MQEFINAMHAAGTYPLRESDIVPCEEDRLIDDHKKEKTIYYYLTLDGQNAYGRWYDCRLGEGGSWWTKKGSKVEKKEWAEAVKAKEAQAEKVKARRQTQVAIECKAKYLKFNPCISHPYLTKKCVERVRGLRIDGDLLVIPVLTLEGELLTLQTITPNGDKYFIKDGRKKGGLFPIGFNNNEIPTHIYICEGLSTGLSIYQTLDRPVVCAFDRGNLKEVAIAVKAKYPDALIIFAADNDEKAAGDPTNESNPGVYSAQQAAVKIGARWVVWPDEAGEDWNDVFLRDPEILKNKLLVRASTPDLAANPYHSPQPFESGDIIIEGYDAYDSAYDIDKFDNKKVSLRADGNPDWFNRMLWSKEPNKRITTMYDIGELHDGKSLSNTITFLKNEFAGLFVLNDFSDEILVRVCPPWTTEDEFRVHRLQDYDVTMMTATLEFYGFKPSVERTRQAIEAVAAIDRIHPVRHYFSLLKWDGVPRLGTWLEHYCGAVHQPKEYLERVGTMWLVAAAKRIYEPGAVFQNMLVLEGAQNIGKSRTLRELATFGHEIEEEYFTDAIRFKHIDKPSALQILQGKLIVEFAELADMNAESDESLKAWIGQNADEMIKKWEVYPTRYQRQFVLAGTTNNDTWLKDPTGNRRYWPVRCTKFLHDEIRKDKEQLWAEAVHLYKNDYPVTMPNNDPIYDIARVEQAARLMEDPWEAPICVGIRNREYVSYDDLYGFLHIPIKERNKDNQKTIRSIMSKLGWEYGQKYALTKDRTRVWYRLS
jgi:predicted P-loop ATPase/phage/plasmid primase-like uncharacterized protein